MERDKNSGETGQIPADSEWDTSSNPEFYEYYAEKSRSEESLQRFRALRDTLVEIAGAGGQVGPFDVADIGGGAGTLAMIWAEQGHRVVVIDVNEPLIELGRKRAGEAGLDIRFEVGSATRLPWPDESVDMCLVPELLEHVVDATDCLDEFARVLRKGGLLFISTTNALCPMQQEFTLPLYSWYPGFLKRRYERLAVTTRPEIVNHAKYPAVHWFTFYGLRRLLAQRGFSQFMDRFDLLAVKDTGTLKRVIVGMIRTVPGLRLAGQLATPGSIILAIK